MVTHTVFKDEILLVMMVDRLDTVLHDVNIILMAVDVKDILES